MSRIIKILFFVVLAIGIYLLAYGNNSKKTEKVSEILLEMGKYLERLIAIDLKTDTMMTTDPFNHLVEEVRPLLDSVGHISAQTRIYESMERMPGGPTSFMNPSLATLRILEVTLFDCESRYRLIVAGTIRNLTALANRDLRALHDDFITVFGDNEEFLQNFRIYMSPQDEKDVVITTTLEEILTVISRLHQYFAEFEEVVGGKNVLEVLRGKIKINTSEEAQAAIKIHEVSLEHGDTTLPQLGQIWTQTIQRIDKKVDDYEGHFNKLKVRYEDLANGVAEDIKSTAERVRNLANVNAKKIEL